MILEDAEVDFGDDGEDVVADVDVGNNNADLYAANQESAELADQ